MLSFTVTDINGIEKKPDKVIKVTLDSDRGVPADSLCLTCVYDEGLRSGSDRICAYDGDKLVFVGQLDSIITLKRGKGVVTMLSARSLAAALLDNEAEPLTYVYPSAVLMESRHLKPFGIKLENRDTVPYYNQMKIDKGMSHWQALQSFCRNRYQCEPRITGDGRAILDGKATEESVTFSDCGGGTAYYELRESRLRCRLLSEVRLKFMQANTYSSVIKNQNPEVAHVRRVRYVNAASDKATPATADKMLDNSNRSSYLLKLSCAGCHTGLTGKKAVVEDSVLGRLEGLRVERVKYSADKSGERSEITLRKERFYVADELHNK